MRKDIPMAEVDISVVCITYNHEKYIREAIDSFLMQAYDQSKIEIIIADDASTDGTRKIVQEYAANHPNIVPILNEKNIGIQKNLLGAMGRAKGKYIALCEGDDYWTDASKLRKQFKKMEAQPSASVCFHRVRGVLEAGGEDYIFPDPTIKTTFSLTQLLHRNYIQTNSVMYRNLRDYGNVVEGDVLPLDWLLHLYHAREGKILFVDKIMSVYRRHEGSVWWKDENNQLEFWSRNALRHLRFFENVERLFKGNNSYLSIIHETTEELIEGIFLEVGTRDKYKVTTQIAKTFPRYVVMTILRNLSEGGSPHIKIQNLAASVKMLTQEISTLENEKIKLLSQIQQRDDQLLKIVNSRSWQITKPLRALNKHRFD